MCPAGDEESNIKQHQEKKVDRVCLHKRDRSKRFKIVRYVNGFKLDDCTYTNYVNDDDVVHERAER